MEGISDDLFDRLWVGEFSTSELKSLLTRSAVIAGDYLHSCFSGFHETLNRSTAIELARSVFEVSLPPLDSCTPDERMLVLWEHLNDIAIACPEWVFALGFDEVRYGARPVRDPTLSESANVYGPKLLLVDESNLLSVLTGDQIKLLGQTLEGVMSLAQYRTPDGVWHDFRGVFDRAFPPQVEPGAGESRVLNEWFSLLHRNWAPKIRKARGTPERIATLPHLTRYVAYSNDTQLQIATRSILRELSLNAICLSSLHWRTLEEIVAELLYSMGLEIVITGASRDGGRDVIARGELIPGEPTVLAVEVKHKRVVRVADLRQALWANRRFPALLFATSGSFSAGVYREYREQENRLRLYLKDGYGLQQWIDAYVGLNIDNMR